MSRSVLKPGQCVAPGPPCTCGSNRRRLRGRTGAGPSAVHRALLPGYGPPHSGSGQRVVGRRRRLRLPWSLHSWRPSLRPVGRDRSGVQSPASPGLAASASVTPLFSGTNPHPQLWLRRLSRARFLLPPLRPLVLPIGVRCGGPRKPAKPKPVPSAAPKPNPQPEPKSPRPSLRRGRAHPAGPRPPEGAWGNTKNDADCQVHGRRGRRRPLPAG